MSFMTSSLVERAQAHEKTPRAVGPDVNQPQGRRSAHHPVRPTGRAGCDCPRASYLPDIVGHDKPAMPHERRPEAGLLTIPAAFPYGVTLSGVAIPAA